MIVTKSLNEKLNPKKKKKEVAKTTNPTEKVEKVYKKYSNYSTDELKKKKKDIQNKMNIVTGADKNADGKISLLETFREMYRSAAKKSNTDSKEYKTLSKEYKDVNNALNKKVVDEAKITTVDKITDPIFHGAEKANEGLNTTVQKIRNIAPDVMKTDKKKIEPEAPTLGDLYDEKIQKNTKSKIGKVYHDLAFTTGNMLPAMVAPTTSLSLAATGATTFGNSYKDAINEGKTDKQATKYGLLEAGKEVGLQKAIGGLSGVYGESALGKVTNKTVNKYLSKIIKNPNVRKYLSELGGEFSEEYLQEILEPVVRNAAFDENNKFKPITKEALYSGLLGALNAGLMNSPQLLNKNYSNQQINQTQDIINQKNEGKIDAAQANEMLKQVREGTYNQNQIVNRVAQERVNEISNNSNLTQGQKADMIKAVTQTLEQQRANINSNVQNTLNNDSLEQNNINANSIEKTNQKAYNTTKGSEEYYEQPIESRVGKFDKENSEGRLTRRESKYNNGSIEQRNGQIDKKSTDVPIDRSTVHETKNERRTYELYENSNGEINSKQVKFTNDKINKLVNDYNENKPTFVAKITPRNFLEMTASSDLINEFQNELKSNKNTKLDMDKLNESDKYITLTVDMKTGKVLEHDGRHRMLNMLNSGVDSTDVVIIPASGTYDAKSIRNHNVFQLSPQDITNSTKKVNLTDMIPTTKENLNEISKKYLKGTSDSSFSNDTIAERKSDNVITLKNPSLEKVSQDNVKNEDTGISIGDKKVQLPILKDSKPNKLGQYVPKDGFTKSELKDGKLRDSKFYKNVTERADFIKDEVKQKIQDDDYIKHYSKITNEESMQEAFNDLNTRGTEAIADFFNNNKELTSKDTAMGWLLIEQSQANGDYDFVNQVLRKMRSNATSAAQTLQMYNYYARLTPEGMYKWCGDQLLRAEEIFEKGKTKKWIENNKKRWQLNQKETDFIKDQMEIVQELNKMDNDDITTIDIKGKQKEVSVERAKQVEIAKIQSLIENKLPAKKGAAINAWMRISMLGNLKTIGTRNPLGNIALRPVNDVGDFFASMVDYAISKKTGVRTKGNFNPFAQLKGAKQGGSEAIQDFRLKINTRDAKGNRFEIGDGKSFNENHNIKALNLLSKAGNKADRGVSFLLDLGDRPFYQAAYEQSLQNQMKLNNISNIEEVTDSMKQIAETEALERTYQDDNNYTRSVIAIRNAMNKMAHFKGYGLGDIIIPFAKTPANLTKAIVDYSPAGFINALTKGKELKTSIDNGQFTPQMQHKFVNQLGKATAGTLLYALGAALAKSGVITGGSDKDKDVADFMKNTLGIQPYSIKIGDKTYTYDWAQPVASALAIPADIKKGIEEAKNKKVDLQYIIHSAFSTAGNILLEQSFLQGIKEVLGGYGDPVDNLMSEIEGLPARAIPTLFQQITTYLDGTKKMSYGNDGFANIISQAQAKTPFASKLPKYRNSMGKEIKMYGGKNNFFNVFINPANYSEGNATESAKEIYKVYQATNKKEILPRLVDSNLKNEDGSKLTNQQKSDFLEISGGIIDKNVKKLKTDSDYQQISDEDKANTIKNIVDYAYNKAREKITGHELSSKYKKTDKAVASGYAIADYYITKQTTKKETSSSTSDRNRYQELKEKGIDGKTYDKFKAFVTDVRADKNAKGNSIPGSKKRKIINYIQSLPLTAQQKQNLYDDYKNNQGVFTYYK